MKSLILLVLLLGSNVYADTTCVNCDKVVKDMSSEQRECAVNKLCHDKQLKAEVNKLKKENEALKKELAEANAKYSSLVYQVHHQVEENVYPNSISLVGGASPTKLTSNSSVNGNTATLSASTEYQPDFGLMYQRDLYRQLRLSLEGTIRGSALLGLGINF